MLLIKLLIRKKKIFIRVIETTSHGSLILVLNKWGRGLLTPKTAMGGEEQTYCKT